MGILMDHIISWMVAVPFLGIGILAFVRDEEWIRRIAFGITLVQFFIALII